MEFSTSQLLDFDFLKSSVLFVFTRHTFIIISLPGGYWEPVKKDYQLSKIVMFKVPFVNYVVLIIICAILSRQIKIKSLKKKWIYIRNC